MSAQREGCDDPFAVWVRGNESEIARTRDERIRPLLRWIGGKQQIAPKLISYLPQDHYKMTYREPFLGAGALFFYLQPETAILSDLNTDLIRVYKSIATDPYLIARYLRKHACYDSKDYYYVVRDAFNQAKYYTVAQAARFIYLNRTCFNGVYRVNKKGEFNVPYGSKANPIFPNVTHLRNAAAALSRAKLKDCDFELALQGASKGDFVYLDPPYPALNGTSYFTHYTINRFNTENQERLAEIVQDLDRRGCKVLMTNADTKHINTLYYGFNRVSLGVPRYVTSRNVKHEVSELIITNY